MSTTLTPSLAAPFELRRWPGERYWLVVVALFALLIWVLLAVTVIGLVYALLLGIFFFAAHTVFVTHLRGSAVRLGAAQLPALHERVVRIASRMGLEEAPEAYLMQAGGALNALATKYLGRDCIVLYSDLVDACGDDGAALDFIIAHELAHLRAGHLRLRWLLLPGLFMPLVGSAYSRACEYTADRAALDACARNDAALQGLVILTAGGKLASAVDRRQLIAQVHSLDTPWMKLGQWLSSHPPIAWRLAALLGLPLARAPRAALGAAGIVALGIGLPVVASVLLVTQIGAQMQAAAVPTAAAPAAAEGHRQQVEQGVLALVELAEAARVQGALPADADQLYALWQRHQPGVPEPRDPYTGERYRYEAAAGHYRIWSPGLDRNSVDDDLYYDSRLATR
jgi:Zn-dependent protease with chaperone function